MFSQYERNESRRLLAFPRVVIAFITLFVICATVTACMAISQFEGWRVYTGKKEVPTREISLPIWCSGAVSCATSDAKHAVFANVSNEIFYLGDLESGQTRRFAVPGIRSFQSASFLADGRHLVIGAEDGSIHLWDLESGKQTFALKGHEGYVRAVICCAKNVVASGGDDSVIVLWDIERQTAIGRLLGHTGAIMSGCLTVDGSGKRLLSGSWDGTIRLWDTGTGKQLVCLKPERSYHDRVMSVALSQDGKYALSSYLENQAAVYWDLEKGMEINRFVVKGNPWIANRPLEVKSVCFSRDGRRALFGLVFGSVVVWDVENWKEIAFNRVHKKQLAFAHFSSDEKSSISVGVDKDAALEDISVRWWTLPVDPNKNR